MRKYLHSILLLGFSTFCLAFPKQEQDSIRRILSAYDWAQPARDSSIIRALIDYGHDFRFKNSDSLFYYTEWAEKELKASRLNLPYVQTLIFRNYGYYYSEEGASEEALNQYQKALRIAEKEGFSSLHLKALIWISDEYYYLDDKGKELLALLKVIDMGEKKKEENARVLSIAHENIAFLYADHAEYDTAMRYFQNALSYNEILGDPVSAAQTYTNLADAYMEQGEYRLALDYLEKAIPVFKAEEELVWLATALQIKGLIYYETDRFEESKQLYLQAFDLHRQLDDERSLTSLQVDMGKTVFRKGQLKEAKKYAQNAMTSSVMESDYLLKKEAQELLYEISKAEGRNADALAYLEIYRSLADSLAEVQKTNRLNLLWVKTRFDAEKQAIQEANAKKEIRQKNVTRTSLLLVVLLIALLIPLYLKQRRLNRLNNELRDREEELVLINRKKDIMFSVVGHDLKSPLTTFHATIKLYKDRIFGKKELKEGIHQLDDNLDHILFTLDNLLYWGASEFQGRSTQARNFDFSALTKEVIQFLKPMASAKELEIDNQIKGEVSVYADPNQIEMVLRNLISNAIKFTPPKGKPIVVSVEEKNNWVVKIKDCGIGIPASKQCDLLKELQIKSAKGTQKEKGTGLGLVLSKRVLQNNKGELHFESSEGEGSLFYFSLPKAEITEDNTDESHE